MDARVWGEAVRRYREALGLSQAEVAWTAGKKSHSWLSRRETGAVPLTAREFSGLVSAVDAAAERRLRGR